MSLKRYLKKTATPATTAVASTNSEKKVKSSQVGLTVLNDRVLIRPDAPEKYEGQLTIPDAYKAFYENLPSSGIVESHGPKCKIAWKQGQRVRFAKMAGAKLKYMGQDYLIVREYDCDAIEC